MASSVRILPSADIELAAIAAQLAARSSQALASFLDAYEAILINLQSGLVSYPLSRQAELAALGYHAAIVDTYVILYYLEKDTAVIAHIFSQRQDYAHLV